MAEALSSEEEEAVCGFFALAKSCIFSSLQRLIIVLNASNFEFVERYCNRDLRRHCHCNKEILISV